MLVHHEEGTSLATYESIEDPYVHQIVAEHAGSGDRDEHATALTGSAQRVADALEPATGLRVVPVAPAGDGEPPSLLLAGKDAATARTDDDLKAAAFALIEAGLSVEYVPPGLIVTSGDGTVTLQPAGVTGTSRISDAAAEEIYWANFYAHTEYTSGSTFFDRVVTVDRVPRRLIDLGCGDGRDSYAFAAAGWSVLGVDRSRIAVAHAGRKAEQLDHAEAARFVACDVADVPALRATLQAELDRAGDEPVMFYARFFLHSIPEDVQDGLMAQVAELARPGDWFAAEFRTDADASSQKVHQKHYRRFQNGPAFGHRLSAEYGFTPVEVEEGTGLSPYRGEDPHLYRIIARRP